MGNTKHSEHATRSPELPLTLGEAEALLKRIRGLIFSIGLNYATIAIIAAGWILNALHRSGRIAQSEWIASFCTIILIALAVRHIFCERRFMRSTGRLRDTIAQARSDQILGT